MSNLDGPKDPAAIPVRCLTVLSNEQSPTVASRDQRSQPVSEFEPESSRPVTASTSLTLSKIDFVGRVGCQAGRCKWPAGPPCSGR